MRKLILLTATGRDRPGAVERSAKQIVAAARVRSVFGLCVHLQTAPAGEAPWS